MNILPTHRGAMRLDLPLDNGGARHHAVACTCNAPHPKTNGADSDLPEWKWVEAAFSDPNLLTYFQPIVDAHSGALEGYETLMRSQNGAQIIGAGELIAACKEWNVLPWMDKTARLAAIRAVARVVPQEIAPNHEPNHEAALSLPRYFINFLPSIVYDPAVCLKTTMDEAAKWNVPLESLVFEVSESEPIQSMNHLKNVLAYYRDNGAQTAVDDLGIGYATAAYLPLLCPDYLKISLEWLRRAENETASEQTLRALIEAAHEQNAQVIIEGVETAAQHELCLRVGADFLQGFLFGRPAPTPTAPVFSPTL